MIKSRKLKIVSIDERHVFDWFVQASRSWTSSAQLIDLPMISVLPPDYQVLEVRHEPFRKAFVFLVHSESFDEVSSGDEIPGMIAAMRYESVEIRTDEDRWREQNHIQSFIDHHEKQGDQFHFKIGEVIEWSPDLQQTWRGGIIREIDLPNARITVQQGNTVYAIAYRDVSRPAKISTADLDMRDRFGHPSYNARPVVYESTVLVAGEECGDRTLPLGFLPESQADVAWRNYYRDIFAGKDPLPPTDEPLILK